MPLMETVQCHCRWGQCWQTLSTTTSSKRYPLHVFWMKCSGDPWGWRTTCHRGERVLQCQNGEIWSGQLDDPWGDKGFSCGETQHCTWNHCLRGIGGTHSCHMPKLHSSWMWWDHLPWLVEQRRCLHPPTPQLPVCAKLEGYWCACRTCAQSAGSTTGCDGGAWVWLTLGPG